MYNVFPWLLKWISSRKEFHRLSASSQQKNLEILTQLKETLNPQRCRGLIDAFMVHMQSLEVRMHFRRVLASAAVSAILPSPTGIWGQQQPLPPRQPSLHHHEPVCRWHGHHSHHAEMGASAHGQIPSDPESVHLQLLDLSRFWDGCQRLLHLQTRSRRS